MADEQPKSPEPHPPAEAPAPEPAAAAAPPVEPPAPAAPVAEPPAEPAAEKAPAPQAAPAPAPEAPASAPVPPPKPAGQPGKTYTWGTGRRKKSIARVRIAPGTGKFLINQREVENFFKTPQDQAAARSPLEAANLVKAFDVWANVKGGGTTGQAGAVLLGLARALAKAMPQAEHALREKDLMTRDARIKERKKFGRRGARRGLQWAKR